jgi:small-conductance mechanosensitive channel
MQTLIHSRIFAPLAPSSAAASAAALCMTASPEFASRSVRHILLLLLVLLFLSPLLSTLTSSYSSDTIWTLTAILACVHVCAFDYQWINQSEEAKKESVRG